jgi:hypothetical protein
MAREYGKPIKNKKGCQIPVYESGDESILAK